jgi:uncharacterized protein (DUF433 family)
MSPVNLLSHIELRTGPRGETPFIAGHRVRVQDVVLWSEEGLTPDEIVVRVPSISLADVHAALAYYFDHRDDIDRQIRDDLQYSSDFEAAANVNPSPRP